jgi:hypothetical protein
MRNRCGFHLENDVSKLARGGCLFLVIILTVMSSMAAGHALSQSFRQPAYAMWRITEDRIDLAYLDTGMLPFSPYPVEQSQSVETLPDGDLVATTRLRLDRLPDATHHLYLPMPGAAP